MYWVISFNLHIIWHVLTANCGTWCIWPELTSWYRVRELRRLVFAESTERDMVLLSERLWRRLRFPSIARIPVIDVVMCSYACAFCGKNTVKRTCVGIWECKKCGKVLAGGACLHSFFWKNPTPGIMLITLFTILSANTFCGSCISNDTLDSEWTSTYHPVQERLQTEWYANKRDRRIQTILSDTSWRRRRMEKTRHETIPVRPQIFLGYRIRK